jgi:L-methionine (R)-S-oxide reductase
MTRLSLPDTIQGMDHPTDWNAKLARILHEFSCQTGTLHQSTDASKTLTLVCQIGVPENLVDKITIIPFGKGIAGAAAATGEAVELCNLQENLGGVARVDARKTGVAGSIAVPIFAESSGEVIGTLGIGKFAPYDFSPDEKQRLREIAAQIAAIFMHKGT